MDATATTYKKPLKMLRLNAPNLRKKKYLSDHSFGWMVSFTVISGSQRVVRLLSPMHSEQLKKHLYSKCTKTKLLCVVWIINPEMGLASSYLLFAESNYSAVAMALKGKAVKRLSTWLS